MSVIGSNILAGASGQGGDYTISNSVRLRSSASANLTRTPASAGSLTTWTWSAWVKRGTLGVLQTLFGTSSTEHNVFFTSGNVLTFQLDLGGANDFKITTTQVFRDPSAWYHIVAVWDTTNATSSNRMRFYVNGVEITSFSVTNYPTSSLNGGVNSTIAHYIGNLNTARYFDGYITEVNFIDGQALTPSSFGANNASTGVWQPKRYAGTYGTNGFYLPFTDNSALTTSSNVGLGKDFSGNGNYWTTNNISITAGVTYDSMTDVPTLTSATAANYCVLNPLTGDATESSANLNLTGVDVSTIGTMSFASTGKWYFEMDCVSNVATTNNDGVGIATFPINDSSPSKVFYIYRSSGVKLQSGGSNTSYGASFTTGDVIGVAYDADAGTLVFYKNNSSQGTAYTGISGTFFPVVYARGITSTPVLALNCGQRPFAYTPPTGFVALNTFNLPTPTIGATASTQANKYFDVSLYTGNAPSSVTVTGLNFQPDLVWLKSRTYGYDHVLTDAVRGVEKGLASNATYAEFSPSGNPQLTAFNSNGFTVGNNDSVNRSGAAQLGWAWKANGSGSTNTAGSITSTVSANTSAGFSVVTYTGNGSAGATVGHGLGVALKMLIVKNRVQGTYGNWNVWHTALTGSQYLTLNDTAGAGTNNNRWNGTIPTSTVFSLGADSFGNTNKSGDTYVAYCFSEVSEYSKFGSYTGNGSTDGTFVFTGFSPKYVMMKKTSSTGNWIIFDSARGVFNLNDNYLYANSSDSEGTSSSQGMDFLSNGFKNRNTYTDCNDSGATYIYMAFAENPFKYSLAR
jgi:hypothetical protein